VAILDFFFRLGAALLMGAAVGLERQWRQRMAGTRTNALVTACASAFVMCAFMVRTRRGVRRRSFLMLYPVSVYVEPENARRVPNRFAFARTPGFIRLLKTWISPDVN
jgi:hypothetical protein